MSKKLVTAAILAASVMGATAPVAQAHSGSNRTQDQYLTVPALLGSVSKPVIPNGPGPKPPPKLTPGPKPPPR